MKAERIHHAKRIKKSREWHHGWKPEPTSAESGRRVHTGKPCSCWTCGNPRKWLGERTIQERKAMQRGMMGC